MTWAAQAVTAAPGQAARPAGIHLPGVRDPDQGVTGGMSSVIGAGAALEQRHRRGGADRGMRMPKSRR